MLARILSILILGSLFVQTSPGQTSSTPQPPGQAADQTAAQVPRADQRTVIRSTSREVLLDMVVRDKHHHAVTDLRQDEVEIYEDGVRQNIRAFHNVQGAEQLQAERLAAKSTVTSSAPGAESAPPLNSLRQINFVSVVLAQIAPKDLEFAREAVLEFLKNDNFPNTYVTVYKLAHSLRVVQGYTSDKDTLVKAVNAASKGLYTEGLGLSAAVASSSNATVQSNVALIESSPLSSPAAISAAQDAILNPLPMIVADPLWARNAASEDVSVTLGTALLIQARLETGLRFTESLSNGMDAMDSLRELVRSQEKLPGRKVILYLADGLAYPVGRRDVVDSVISYANRAGVSFYTIDTRGLSVDDPMMKSLAAQERTGAESSAQVVDPAHGHHEDDDVQLTGVSNTQENMREVAEATGGFAVTNTNEIAIPMQRMMEDIRTHYELAYTPTSTNYDGHFRKIEVRITRPKTTIQTRKGYFALPELNGSQLQPFEVAALNAINTHPAPVEFPYQVSLMKFRSSPEKVEYEVAFEVPVSGLRVVSNPKTGKAILRTSLVALIRNSSGDIVGKVSRDVTREVSNTDLGKLGNDLILYAEPVELPKGHYVVDTAVTDEQAGKTTVKKIAVFVDPGKSLGMSSLELVRRLDPLPGPRDPQDPFETDNGRIVPTLADSVASSKPVDLYFVVYPTQADSGQDVKAILQVFSEGKEVARKPLDLSKPEPDGSIPMLVRLSPDRGQCDVLITAQQGALVAQSGLSVKVE
jgi:VWFA-related protein